jgi:hypothetical protein
MAEDLDALLEDALQHLPAPKAKAKVEGPAYPLRTQHHTPLESESRFVRFAGWWEEHLCLRCHATSRHFDGLYEEREWLKPDDHPSGTKHWLACTVAPLPELLKGSVTYVRCYSTNFCAECLGAASWPLAQAWREGEIVEVQG